MSRRHSIRWARAEKTFRHGQVWQTRAAMKSIILILFLSISADAAFNLLVVEKDRLSAKQISAFVRTAKVPQSITDTVPVDKTYGAKRVLFRRQSGTARVTIFQGGHEIIPAAALHWLAKQQRMRAPKNE